MDTGTTVIDPRNPKLASDGSPAMQTPGHNPNDPPSAVAREASFIAGKPGQSRRGCDPPYEVMNSISSSLPKVPQGAVNSEPEYPTTSPVDGWILLSPAVRSVIELLHKQMVPNPIARYDYK